MAFSDELDKALFESSFENEYSDMKFDYDSLRKIQMDRYNAGEVDKVADESDGGKDFAALKKIWMPLILDVVGGTPWTLEEILAAMEPNLRRIARKWGQSSGTSQYDKDDAFADASMAVLSALSTDKGKSPFGPYADKAASRKVSRHRKVNTGIIGAPLAKRDYINRTQSLHAGGTSKSFSKEQDPIHGVSEIRPQVESIECYNCGGKGIVKPIDPNTGEEIGDVERTCPKCGGSGRVPVPAPAETPSSQPSDKLAAREQMLVQRRFLDYILEVARQPPYLMTPQQENVIKLRFNVDGAATDPERSFPDVSAIITIADEIEKLIKWANEHDRIDDFNQIISKYIPDFNNQIQDKSVAIVISPLFSMTIDDTGDEPIQIEPQYTALMDELRAALTSEFKRSSPKSKTGIRGVFEKAMDKLQKVRQNNPGVQDLEKELFRTYNVREYKEYFNNIFVYNYCILLEEVSKGLVTFDDVSSLAYLI